MISRGEWVILIKVGIGAFCFFQFGVLGLLLICVAAYIDELEKNKT